MLIPMLKCIWRTRGSMASQRLASPFGGLHWRLSASLGAGQHTDVAVGALSLQLCSSAGGRAWPDLRLNLLHASTHDEHARSGMQGSRSGGGAATAARTHGGREGVLRHTLSMSAAAGVALVMAPDTVGPWVAAAALPGMAGLLAPALLQSPLAQRWRLVRAGRRAAREVWRRARRMRAARWALCAVEGTARSAQAVVGGAAALWCAGSLAWQVVPEAMNVASALLGLCSIMGEYNALGARMRSGAVPPGAPTEAAWHAAHKRAAQRVARHLTELHPGGPPLGGVVDVFETASILAALPVGGAGLLGGAGFGGGGGGKLSLSWRCTAAAAHAGALEHAHDSKCAVSTSAARNGAVSGTGGSVHSSGPAASSGYDDALQLTSSTATSSSACSQASDTTSSSVQAASSPEPRIRGRINTAIAQPDVLAELLADSMAAGTSERRVPESPATARQPATNAAPPPTPAPRLVLYGRADHSAPSPTPLTLAQRMALAERALYLVAVFLPFLTVGTCLLLLSLWASEQARQQQVMARQRGEPTRHVEPVGAGAGSPQAQAHRGPAPGASQQGAQDATAAVGTRVSGNEARLAFVAAQARLAAWRLLLAGCRRSGAAFIKWGQWASTRGDLFPPDFCDTLANLHDSAPTHSFAHTRREVEAAFGASLEELFLEFDPRPLASGSVAQVHVAQLRGPDGNPTRVAVKVRHPGVAAQIHRDFQILQPLAGLSSRVELLRGLKLRETMGQFSHTMTAQADLRVEAAHLARFEADFARVRSQVLVPTPVAGMVSEGVLVESYEPGRSVSHFCKRRTPVNSEIVALGVDTYLMMLLKNGFVHTDLHPGNILVRILDERGNIVDDETSGIARMLEQSSSGASSPAITVHQPTAHAAPPGQTSQQQGSMGARPTQRQRGRWRRNHHYDNGHLRAQIILLDFGLAEEVSPTVKHHFVSFLNCIGSGNGKLAAAHLLRWGRVQECPDPAAFTHAVEALFTTHCDITSPKGIDLDLVMKSVLRLACVHHVTIDSAYATLAIAVCVLVGFATSLDPQVNMMDAACPALLAYALTGRVVGRMYNN